MFSGGKDSFYASTRIGNIDAYIVLVYEFPEPSPHLVNLGLSIATSMLAGKPVIAKKLNKGKEFQETVDFLKMLNVNSIVAGDVYIDEHLEYMENIAWSVGATLYEPLWGMDPLELLYDEVEYGIEARIIGVVNGLEELLGKRIVKDTVDSIVDFLTSRGADVLGEKGEYHTIVEYSPIHNRRLEYRVAGRRKTNRGILLELVPR